MRLALFDWDGTLYDSDFLMDQAIERILLGAQLKHTLTELEPHLYRERERPLLSYLRLPQAGRADLVRQIGAAFSSAEAQAELFHGIDEVLGKLKQAGFALGVVTGRNRASFDAAVSKCGLANAFEVTVCGDETLAKPAPDGILKALASLPSAYDAIYVGNQLIDAQSAQAAGMRFLGVRFCTRTRSSELEKRGLVRCLKPHELLDRILAR